ncbi:MAG: hypothetical protein RIC52_01895 [Amphiplicatus sp.]
MNSFLQTWHEPATTTLGLFCMAILTFAWLAGGVALPPVLTV